MSNQDISTLFAQFIEWSHTELEPKKSHQLYLDIIKNNTLSISCYLKLVEYEKEKSCNLILKQVYEAAVSHHSFNDGMFSFSLLLYLLDIFLFFFFCFVCVYEYFMCASSSLL